MKLSRKLKKITPEKLPRRENVFFLAIKLGILTRKSLGLTRFSNQHLVTTKRTAVCLSFNNIIYLPNLKFFNIWQFLTCNLSFYFSKLCLPCFYAPRLSMGTKETDPIHHCRYLKIIWSLEKPYTCVDKPEWLCCWWWVKTNCYYLKPPFPSQPS